ncbi:MAG: hypothetical protein M1820_005945 [Bogoriella megaspora]|nr:MAG: hypothetical protein M1820_005945 [Bogoriella megaspora]
MNSDYHNLNPAIRIQQSTPTPQLPVALSQSSLGMDDWQMFDENEKVLSMSGTPDFQSNGQYRGARMHKREQSSSSMASSGPASPYSRNTAFPFIANTEQSPQSSAHYEGFTGADESATFTKSLPTPTHTPTSTSFLMPQPPESFYQNNYNDSQSAHMAMKQTMMDHHGGIEEDIPAYSHSARQSVSSFGRDSPRTPSSTIQDYDDFKASATGEPYPSIAINDWIEEQYLLCDDESDYSKVVPKFDRTVSDAFQDELYNPTLHSTSAPPPPAKKLKPNSAGVSPMRNVINERLQQAERVRSQSPATASSGPVESLIGRYVTGGDWRSPGSLLGSAAGSREQQKQRFDAIALKQNHLSPSAESQANTISPKDALLDYQEEDDKMPLFPGNDSTNFAQNFPQGQWSTGQQQQPIPAQSYDMLTAHSNGLPHTSAYTTAPPQSDFSFAMPTSMSNQQFTYPTASYRPATASTSSALEANPEFPAHLTSMESSISDFDVSSMGETKRPARTAADTGTYSCTYHGCPQRFDNPQKLQKHKREGHRSVHHPLNANLSSRAGSVDDAGASGSSMTSEALLARNSQAGPHKCERINPSTGKPCNTVFSRPYDLTRHEDTIHNARKQKVRCALCVEEKTFSRNDALTRHMRVVHPEVDFPGKHRRRGGR